MIKELLSLPPLLRKGHKAQTSICFHTGAHLNAQLSLQNPLLKTIPGG